MRTPKFYSVANVVLLKKILEGISKDDFFIVNEILGKEWILQYVALDEHKTYEKSYVYYIIKS